MGSIASRCIQLSTVLLSSALACQLPGSLGGKSGSAAPPALQSQEPPPSPGELANASYKGIADEGSTLALVDGSWKGAPFEPGGASRPRVTIAPHFRLLVDLDGDGAREAAVVLSESSGGSGTNDFLVVVQRRDGDVRQVASAPIGDRVQLRAARAVPLGVELDVIEHAEADAMCCPSQKSRRTLLFTAEGLRQTSSVIQGTLSLSDLEGVDWRLSDLGSNEDPLPERARVTLRFGEDRASGATTCNRYFTAPRAGEQAGELTFDRIGSTRMACPPAPTELERRYLRALGSVSRFGFATGRLVLSGSGESLFFEGDDVAPAR